MLPIWVIQTVAVLAILTVSVISAVGSYRAQYKCCRRGQHDQAHTLSYSAEAAMWGFFATAVFLTIAAVVLYGNFFTSVAPHTAAIRWATAPDSHGIYRDEAVWESGQAKLAVANSNPVLQGTELVNYQLNNTEVTNGSCRVMAYWSGTPRTLLPSLRLARAENIRTVDYVWHIVRDKLGDLEEPDDAWQLAVRERFRSKVLAACKGLPPGIRIEVLFNTPTLRSESVPTTPG